MFQYTVLGLNWQSQLGEQDNAKDGVEAFSVLAFVLQFCSASSIRFASSSSVPFLVNTTLFVHVQFVSKTLVVC